MARSWYDGVHANAVADNNNNEVKIEVITANEPAQSRVLGVKHHVIVYLEKLSPLKELDRPYWSLEIKVVAKSRQKQR